MPASRAPLADTLASLPPEWPGDPLPAIRAALCETGQKLAVLDDDPTGAQTVHDLPELTDWSVEMLAEELRNELPTFYILTNTRAMPVSQAMALDAEVSRNLMQASQRTGREVVIANRSDSTLRGHFPAELDAIADAAGRDFDAWILIPFFLEGGRYTINDVHYVAEGDWLVPAGETEFARDPAFGFRASSLREWVEEKTKGRFKADDVASISLEDIRKGGPSRVAERLTALSGGGVCIVNAASMRDLEVFVQGLLDAESRGKKFLFRTAASFTRARSGQSSHPLLTRKDMGLPDSGGALIVVGSHVPRTTGQLQALLDQGDGKAIEISVDALLSGSRRADEIRRVAALADGELERGGDAIIYTSRQLVSGGTSDESLSIGKQVSDCLVQIARAISVRPRYILAKGGSTSSELATKALGVRRAMVPGQILPGVPVWSLGPETRFPGLKYIVFPGNVGDTDALVRVATTLK
ncbi:MAG: hypothetical protein L0177_06720 [Chloroflexi bacterium]|nr:hypothetical protein [Chloroflexota bacterium]